MALYPSFVVDDTTASATSDEMVSIDAFNDLLRADGPWVCAGCLGHHPVQPLSSTTGVARWCYRRALRGVEGVSRRVGGRAGSVMDTAVSTASQSVVGRRHRWARWGSSCRTAPCARENERGVVHRGRWTFEQPATIRASMARAANGRRVLLDVPPRVVIALASASCRACWSLLRPWIVCSVGVHGRATVIDGFGAQFVVPGFVAVDLA
jgi:hypothetical protein